jgi:hypothetical protein
VRDWIAAFICLISLPCSADEYGYLGWDFPDEFVHPYETYNQSLSVLSYEEVQPTICATYLGSVPVILGGNQLSVACAHFLNAGLVEPNDDPKPEDAPIEVTWLATALDREAAAVMIWEPLAGPAPFIGDDIFPRYCRPLIAAYERCDVSRTSPHSGKWDFYIRREILESDTVGLNRYFNENFLKCKTDDSKYLCEFFDNAALIFEVRVQFQSERKSGDELIGMFRNLQYAARSQTYIRLRSYGAR